jgi:hypothetical protein
VRDIVFQAEEVAQAQGALRRRCSQDARLTGETMPARLRAHPRITGESRTCRSRPLAAGSLCGAAAPREVVIGGELRTPFSLSPQPIPTEGNVVFRFSHFRVPRHAKPRPPVSLDTL